MMSGPVVMNKHVGDEELHASEKEFVNTEGNIMCDTGLVYMKTASVINDESNSATEVGCHVVKDRVCEDVSDDDI